jgi:hypothetical protein
MVRTVAVWVVLLVAVLAASVGGALGIGWLFAEALSPSIEDGHSEAGSLSAAYYFVVGAVVGGLGTLLLSLVGARFLGPRLQHLIATRRQPPSM